MSEGSLPARQRAEELIELDRRLGALCLWLGSLAASSVGEESPYPLEMKRLRTLFSGWELPRRMVCRELPTLPAHLASTHAFRLMVPAGAAAFGVPGLVLVSRSFQDDEGVNAYGAVYSTVWDRLGSKRFLNSVVHSLRQDEARPHEVELLAQRIRTGIDGREEVSILRAELRNGMERLLR